MRLKDIFFKPANGMEPCSTADYLNLKSKRDILISVSNVSHATYYIIDYFEQKFDFFSPNNHLLGGYPAEEVNELGFAFFEKVVLEDDLKMMCQVHEKWFEFYYNLPEERRSHCQISFDIRMIQHLGVEIMVSHIFKPSFFTEGGQIWITLCYVHLSESKEPGSTIIMEDTHESYRYSNISQKFKLQDLPSLTPREEDIKELTDLGLPNKSIAKVMHIEVDTVKFHKKSIYRKLGVSNMK